MNQGYPQNYNQYSGNGYQQQFNGMYQQRHPFPPPWNANMSGQFTGGHFPPQNFHPGGRFQGGPNCNQRPQYSHNNQRGHFNKGPHNNQPHHNNGKNNKKKIDKRDLPENNKYFCDTCDRGFANQEKFKEHVDSHEKCSDPNCSYIAAPKLVRMHYQMQHRTGFAKKIWQLDSPDDVKRWIDERKRNFPTAENIEKKRLLASEKNARGEKLDNKYFGKMRGGHNQNKRGRNRNRKRQYNDCSFPNEDQPSAIKKSCTETLSSGLEETQVKASSLDEDPLSAILQQPHSETERKESETGDVVAAGGLASIMASYAAESDTEESPQSTPIKHETNDTSSQPVTNKKEDPVHQAPKHLTNKQKRNQKKKLVTEVFNTKKPTLLERLLANEIRHERNVLLQCVHYIVKKNFFGVQVDGRRSNTGS